MIRRTLLTGAACLLLTVVAIAFPGSPKRGEREGGSAADKVPAAGGDITITPLIHSSIQIEHAGRNEARDHLLAWPSRRIGAGAPVSRTNLLSLCALLPALTGIQRRRRSDRPVR